MYSSRLVRSPPRAIALLPCWPRRHHGSAGSGSVEAPMSGKIVKIAANVGDRVAARDVLLVMEAMKMEHTIVAPYGGRVLAISAVPGAIVGAGDVLAEIEADT